MKTTVITFCLLFVTTCLNASNNAKSEANTSIKPMTKNFFMAFAKKPFKNSLCHVDTRMASCSGITDIKSCEVVLTKNLSVCEKKILSVMPDLIYSDEELNKYTIELSMCVGLSIMSEKGKSMEEVDTCMRSGFKTF